MLRPFSSSLRVPFVLSRLVLSASTAWVLDGCGGGGTSADAGLDVLTEHAMDGGHGGNDAGSATIASYCAPLAMALCTRAADCGCGVVLPGGALDVGACARRLEAACGAAWGPFVEAGAVVDPARAAACVEAIAAGTPPCGAPSAVVAFAVCEPFVIDAAGLGETCASPYCAGGEGVCVRGEGGGTCMPRGAAGAACEDMFSCATGLACLEGRCRALLAEGQSGCTTDLACAPPLLCVEGTCRARGALGAPCTDTRTCERGLVCEAGTCAARTGTTCGEARPCGSLEGCARPPSCRAPRTLGERCAEDTDCEAALHCDDASGTCAVRPGDGEACARGVVCGPGLGCDGLGGTCRPLPGLGAPCAFGERGPFLCADGLACVEGACGPLPTEGQPCAGVDTCAPGLGCAFGPSGSVCIVPRGEGEPCENRQACGDGLHCGTEGTCAADVALGAPCNPGLGDCGGACVPDASGGFVCRAPLAEGATCLDDADCTAGLTCLVRDEDTRCLPEICGVL
jgi:hypothetical protein